ncbi:microtubule-associated protein futsch [Brachionichthys hirsutus]|uniref:microtubule-associated protein futsch n=1 Tax=Brachionichthys hirsutus TaxID=412623 RepID=UPI0036044FDC
MKPDGVVTVSLEPMETLESNPVNEAAPAVGQVSQQAASPLEEEMSQQPAGEATQVEPQSEQPKEPPPAKTSNKTSSDSKAKTTNKATAKTKPGATSPTKTSRPNTSQSRLSNGMSKPQTNGVAKKTPPAAVKKTTLTAAAPKKPTGLAAVPASKGKVGEKKAAGAASATTSTKPMSGSTTAAKKTPSSSANGVKTSTAAAAAKKPSAPKPTSATATKTSSAASPKPLVSKTTRPTSGTAASSHPTTGTTRTPNTSTTKTAATAKPATPKTSSTTTKSAAPKPTSTTPSGGKLPAAQTSRTTTPVKKDVTKPVAPASKKPAESPLTRPSSAARSAKPETPKSASKSDAAAKKPVASKAADTKTPIRSKIQDGKATSKDVSKTALSKTATTKTSSPKKAVGSSTPTPVKRGPKAATLADPAKGIAAAANPYENQHLNLYGNQHQSLCENQHLNLYENQHQNPYENQHQSQYGNQHQSLCENQHQSQYGNQHQSPYENQHLNLYENQHQNPYENRHQSQYGNQHQSLCENLQENKHQNLEPQTASSLLGMHIQSDPWDMNQTQAPSGFAPQGPVGMMNLQTEEENNKQSWDAHTMEEGEYEGEEEEKENLFMPPPTTLSEGTFGLMAQPQLLGASPKDDFTPRHLTSPREKEDEVEKADREINEDDDFEEEEEEEEEGEYEYEEQRRLGHQPSSIVTDMSMSLPSEDFQVRPSTFGGSAGWHGDDLLSGMDSEDVSSCTSSRQQGVSDLSSTQHTALLEGTQSSDALIDSSLRGSEGDCNLMGSPNVETLANEEEEDEDEEDERVDDMDLSSERIEEHRRMFEQQEREPEEEDDEDVEMRSEGVTESCGHADEDDFNEEERLDNLNLSGPPTSTWGQANPFSPWAQPASLVSVSSPSPVSDHGAVESETPVSSPAQAHLDGSAPSFVPQSEDEPEQHQSAHGEARVLGDAPAVDVAAHSGSETSTPEDLREYDSSSGVESRSDKQQTPVPASVHPDMDQDLGIHLEKGDEEEEEAETLPADEILGTGPPTAPASAQSSPSTSGDEASDTEGEVQINDPDTSVMVGESAGFESPTAACCLPALEEDEEAADAGAGEGEEDGGGTTPQSANSVASYGFDCTTSNSNAHSMAESCGKSPGIFSLENEEQLPEEAKDPSLIKELTLPSGAAAAQSEDLLGRPVDLMPLGLPGENQSGLDEHHYMLGGKAAGDHLEGVDPMEPTRHLEFTESGDANDSQPPYYSTICDKTDSFLAGNV